MIATWMLYAVAIGGLLTLAALVTDRLAASRGLPMRHVWLASIAATALWPVFHAIQQLLPREADPAQLMPFTITLQPVVSAGVSTPDRAALLDRGLLALWIVLSIALAARLLRGIVIIRRTQRSWREGDVDGVRVRLSENIGPAVVGLRPMDVVLPEWILALDPHLRAIVLRHEEEHRLARDPYLLCAAGVAVALMPWNPALWIQAKRLRLAIEMDCDGRVLRAHPSPERYGMLMLTIAQRKSITPAMFAPMLSEPTTQLERRILAMRSRSGRQQMARITLYAALAVVAGALFVACALDSTDPTASTPPARPIVGNANTTYFDFQVEQTASPVPGNTAPRYPDMLRSANVEGEVLLQFVVDTAGRADMATFKVLRSTHDLFTNAVKSSLPTMRFYPARVGGKAVRQLVQMPFLFTLSKGVTAQKPVPPAPPGKARIAQVSEMHRESVQRAAAATNAGDVSAAPASSQARVPSSAASSNPAYFDFQVEQRATPVEGSASPRYPDELRSANIEGEVVAQFVVDANGRPDMSTFKVIKSTHDLFTNSVRQSVPNIRFHPAMVGTKTVKSLVQMPFEFSLTK